MVIKCKWCSEPFDNIRKYGEHLRADLAVHPYYCQRCKLGVKNYQRLKDHFERSPVHDSSNPIEGMNNVESYCLPCRRQFKSTEELTSHFSFVHEERKRCPTCDKWFGSSYACRAHMASPTHNPRIIPCPHCTKLFKTTSGVAHHMEAKRLKKVTETVVQWDVEHRITDIVYSNRIREVESDDEDDDILVMRTNPGLEQILKVLATADAWDEEEQAFVCPVADCEQLFRRLRDLNNHLKSQIHRTDPSTFRCPRCSKRSSVVSALIQHLESKSCGLSGTDHVNQIYTGLHDMFKRLLQV